MRVASIILRAIFWSVVLWLLTTVTGICIVTFLLPLAGSASALVATFLAGLLVGWFVQRLNPHPGFHVAIALLTLIFALTYYRTGWLNLSPAGLLIGALIVRTIRPRSGRPPADLEESSLYIASEQDS